MQRFIDNGDNTVTDTKHNIVWMKSTLTVGKDIKTTENAVAELGSEWRIPTVDEQLTLVDRNKYGPAIDTEVFPDTKNDWYWTSTPCAWNPEARWVVSFDYGDVLGHPQGARACVRACRSVVASQ